MRIAWLALLAACGNKAGSTADHVADWPTRPTVAVDGAVPVGHQPGPAYTLELPKGLVPDVSDSGYSETGSVFYWAGDASNHDMDAPNVMVTLVDTPATIEAAQKSVYSDPTRKLVRQDAIDRGFVLTWRGDGDKRHGWTVHVFKTLGAKTLMCRAEQYSDDAAPAEPTRAMLEKVCLSLRPRS